MPPRLEWRSMQRLTLAAIGWLIGIATAAAWPALTTERMMLASLERQQDVQVLHDYSNQGWIVSGALADRYYVLERPRLRLP